ncbi:MAG: acetyltransferase [Pyrinomonadaceae bacterium]|nr:acetyltransferase [Pyrinomonadaceae bacterium]
MSTVKSIKRQTVLGVCLLALLMLLYSTAIRPTSALKSSAVVALEDPAPSCHDDEFHPTARNRPVGPLGTPLECATFIDPTVQITRPRDIDLHGQIYVGPFARLLARQGAKIKIEGESNVQDNVTIHAHFGRRNRADEERIKAIGLGEEGEGVEIAERSILAHGSTVKGPAKIGIGGTNIEADPHHEQNVFISFGAEVDGAILERNTGLSALARVGPGVILRSGHLVLPGKNVTTQAEADDTTSENRKVRLVTEADVAFNIAVLEVNVGLAKEYSRLAIENPNSVLGINVDPGGNTFDPQRDAPKLAGLTTIDPSFRNRIIGDVIMGDNRETLNRVMGARISLRADEGGPFIVRRITSMADNCIFHALENNDLVVGNNVTYGERVIVHGGGRIIVAGEPEDPTVIGNNVTLKNQAVVFRSFVARNSVIGEKSAVVGSDLTPGQVIPDRVIYLNNEIFGTVEW